MKSKFLRLCRAASICCVCLASSAFADNARPFTVWSLTWEDSASNVDGTPLTDLAGYYVYAGNSPDTLIPQYFSSGHSMVLFFPAGSTRYFGVTAVNVDGIESTLTSVIGKTL